MERQNRDIISLLEKDNKKKKTATDVVIDKIKSLLLAKELKPGDLIPPENELANAMNVSRGSVREARKFCRLLVLSKSKEEMVLI